MRLNQYFGGVEKKPNLREKGGIVKAKKFT